MRYWSWPKWMLEQCEFYILIRSLIVFLLNQHPPTSENTYKIDQFLKSPHQQWTCINTHVPLGKEFPYEWNRNRDRSISLAPPLHFISASFHPTWANLNILITSINNPQNDDDFCTRTFSVLVFLSRLINPSPKMYLLCITVISRPSVASRNPRQDSYSELFPCQDKNGEEKKSFESWNVAPGNARVWAYPRPRSRIRHASCQINE